MYRENIFKHVILFISGELFTAARLDRETHTMFNVPVIAVDGGGRTGYTNIRVNVADQGDNMPQFKMNDYKANAYSTVDVGTFVLQVPVDYENFRNVSSVVFSIDI